MKRYYILFISFFCLYQLQAQTTYPTNGVNDPRQGHYAFTNATIYVDYNKKIDNGTLIIKEGKVVEVAQGSKTPKSAIIVDCKGKTIYPSFIETFSNYGIPDAKPAGEGRRQDQQLVSDKKGAYYWNEAIKPETQAHEMFTVNKDQAKMLRKIGFGTVIAHQVDGIARGTGTLVVLNEEPENDVILKDRVSAHYSFRRGVSKQSYPSSLMGSIALLRQAYLDGAWYKNQGYKEEYNISLDHWNQTQNLPAIIDAGNWDDILRADKVGDEFGVQYIIRGKGNEYQRLDAVKATNATLIIPVKYPEAYKVEDPLQAHYVDLKELKHWELAPYNLGRVAKANIPFAITSSTLKDKSAFLGNLKKAIKSGLSKEDALKALTFTPAKTLQIDNMVGSLTKGKVANFLICTDDIFDKGTITENWVAGKPFVVKTANTTDYKGQYDLVLANPSTTYIVEISGEPKAPELNVIVDDSTKIKIKHTLKENQVSLNFSPKDQDGLIRLSGLIEGNVWTGMGQNLEGAWTKWELTNKRPIPKKEETKEEKEAKDKKDKEKKEEEDKKDEIGDVPYPFLPYGWTEQPKQEAVLFKNATVWTNTDKGIMQKADVLIKNGKIAQVGKNLPASGATKIDAKGKHITCGIIDEHSHIAISRGVNESAQASSAEVSIGDVVRSEDINIYRQLAGGVTAAQLLHGSANPIGGQSALIKMRWGALPEEMKIEGADGFIKFALGENVTHANWGNGGRSRYPQTRMGVEQVFIDMFTRAKEYEAALKKDPSSVRRDLELETLLEIINKERFITCHSYVQSEITMLMRVCESFGFNVNTFTHILEGYKIADKMKEHGVHASTFSDWWMYKFEVNDAIPHNAAILTEMEVTTAINSDDAEMGRRLNSEAAKAVKYGAMSEEEAWKMVTLNPAKILHLDDKLGTLEQGKDADIVIWSDHPLSVYAKAEKTYVDGRCLWDIEQDEELRKTIQKERNRLVQKMLGDDNGGKEKKTPKPKQMHNYHCDDMEDEGN